MYDYIVLGAGYAGLSAAALLAKEGLSVLLLESHSKIGGCASFYRRKEFTFDVGATTFSGILPHQPVGKLFSELNISPKLKKIDPGLIIKIGNKEIIRHADKNKWIQEAQDIFESSKQKAFWEEVFRIDELAWNFISKNKSLPPKSFTDVLKLARISNLSYVGLLKQMFASVKRKTDQYTLSNILFEKFLDEQLLITTQNYRSDAPFLTAAMGLAYPSETYYPYGGMYKPALEILNSFKDHGGDIKFKREATKITQINDHYSVETGKDESFNAKGIISSIPIWNMAEITEGEIRKYFNKYSSYFDFAWGAFTLNFAIETKIDLPTVYYQIHTNAIIPNTDSRSFFVSFSEKDDLEKAPEGWRTVTISCHTKVERWQNNSRELYEEMKSETSSFILLALFNNIPELEGSKIEWELAGSPSTFEYYTLRKNGYVGGIPHSIKKSILRMPPNQTPFKNLYQIGDTAFPGQGTPGVVLGALSAVERVLN